jgi:hypothetical protein
MNDPEVAPLWAEDETIGWIYQYFNSKEERKKMREDSPTPRNSRELAVRNQFFTPRYVVEFLTDNTLGRIWYEMTKGETRLKEQCRYLVRRPTEIFLNPGEEPPASDESAEQNLSREELLRQPAYIPHRPLKDPREIRVLDPACGSMHFGLYAFDLLEAIYDEAWDWEAAGVAPSIERSSELKLLRESYADKETFLRDVPRLIVEHNLHGIDIDPRAVQIAGLSLWLRAQRAWQQQGAKAADRPRIRRSNIVCAEPMPGEESLLNEFIERHLSATPELRLVAQLTRRIFKAMKLAGEAGSLLKIEEEVAGAVAEAKAQRQAEIEQGKGQDILFADLAKHEQQPLDFEVAEVTDETFWGRAEEDIYKALREYAEQAENGGGYQRRLFTDDAERGFAFIDGCRKRYDVVLMNPPFGDASVSLDSILSKSYFETRLDLFAAFCERMGSLVTADGIVGAITPRDGFFKKTLLGWRSFIMQKHLEVVADLGIGVLDSATVRVAAYTFRPLPASDPTCFIDLVDLAERDVRLEVACRGKSDVHLIHTDTFKDLPLTRFLYWLPDRLWQIYRTAEPIENRACTPRYGLTTMNDDRFCRLFFEVVPEEIGIDKRWVFLSKGGDDFPYGGISNTVVLWQDNAAEMAEVNRQTNGQTAQTRRALGFYFKPALSFSNRSVFFSVRWHPKNYVFSMRGPAIIPLKSDLGFLLAYFNSRVVRTLIQMQTASQTYTTGVLKELRWVPPDLTTEYLLREHALTAFRLVRTHLARHEVDPFFCGLLRSQESPRSIKEFVIGWNAEIDSINSTLKSLQIEIDRLVGSLYGTSDRDLDRCDHADEEDQYVFPPELCLPLKPYVLLVNYLLGCAFERWSANSSDLIPTPEDPAPTIQPAAADASKTEPILVDDSGHAQDIVKKMEGSIARVFPRADSDSAIEELEELIGEPLRNWSRNELFKTHLSIYTGFGRQAPIYWPLSTRSGEYTLWLYYHRLNDQTLYACVNNFVEPKLRQVSEAVNKLRGKGGGRTRNEEKDFERLQDFEQELQEFRDELLRLAKLPWRPNLNDGVQITAAPLWKLFRLPKWQKTLKETWQSLEKGNYDWAHLAMTLWPQNVVPKCVKDRSLAIAHGVEDLFWVEDNGRWRALQSPKQEIEEQKRRRRSEAGERTKRLLCELAGGADGQLSAADVGNRLASGGYDDRELALLLYPQRMAEKCWEEVVLAERLGLKLPAKKTKSAREKFIKEIVARGCAELAPLVEAALDGRARSFADVWQEIERGERDDLALALALWSDRVVERCAEDRALAKHHGLRKFFWVQHPTEEWRRRLSVEEEISNEVAWRRCVAAGLAAAPVLTP